MGVNSKIYNMTLPIVVDRLFFVYLYMAREGIEKLLNITDFFYFFYTGVIVRAALAIMVPINLYYIV